MRSQSAFGSLRFDGPAGRCRSTQPLMTAVTCFASLVALFERRHSIPGRHETSLVSSVWTLPTEVCFFSSPRVHLPSQLLFAGRRINNFFFFGFDFSPTQNCASRLSSCLSAQFWRRRQREEQQRDFTFILRQPSMRPLPDADDRLICLRLRLSCVVGIVAAAVNRPCRGFLTSVIAGAR